MIAKELKQIIRRSEKRGIVTYKGKDARKEFDESVSQKKISLMVNFIREKTEDVSRILS
ncbi:hypothetical protein [Chryseobacterium arthrosphaerae]|uniref:hypothetical protein n=1 Tax=Chryseobacterium arthrosphaerae TaxID=651561 RepID=UPI001E347BF4|nr:hypothetical protein [Chryseobacterium arthrosphaerae]UEQ75246.1 hypothetical protein J8N07_16490 [Chryseobacterium arthrosphaerae]